MPPRRWPSSRSRQYGRLDILHNNVGIGAPGTPETVTLDDWHKVLEANLTTTMLCTKYCLPRMKEGGGGSIIMVSSIAGALGLIGSPGAVAYATAKAGLHGFTLSVAADYATQNIRANCIVVGSVHTPMVAHMGAEARERRSNMVPMQTEGTAWDIAHGAVYLASDELRWVTGLMLPIDGGLVAPQAVAALESVMAPPGVIARWSDHDRCTRDRPRVGDLAEHHRPERHPDQHGVGVRLDTARLGVVERADQRVDGSPALSSTPATT